MTTTVVWGIKRSGIHHVVNWLYANLGATAKDDLDLHDLHPQLRTGFRDAAAGVAFFNNCGHFSSRAFELGSIDHADFERAAARQLTTVFGIEDCALQYSARTRELVDLTNVLVLRDPLNTVASRLQAGGDGGGLGSFRTDRAFVDLLESYCVEALGGTDHLQPKVVVNFNRFVTDRTHRDSVARALGLVNRDVITEVSTFGGGSSFSGTGPPSSPAALVTRFQQRPINRRLIDRLLEREAIRSVCTTYFGYDLATTTRDL